MKVLNPHPALIKVEQLLEEIKDIDPASIVYIDETGIDTFLYRPYAYAKRGVKAVGLISDKKYKRVGVVAGKLNANIISPLQYDGTMDSTIFGYWFEFYLIPLLPPYSTAVLDNTSFHNKKRLVLITQKFAHQVIFLPPYSPEINLIVD